MEKRVLINKENWLEVARGGCRSVCHLQGVEKLNSVPPNTNPLSGREVRIRTCNL